MNIQMVLNYIYIHDKSNNLHIKVNLRNYLIKKSRNNARLDFVEPF